MKNKTGISQKLKIWKKRAMAYALSISMLLQTDLGVRVSYAADENPDEKVHVLVNGESIDTNSGEIKNEFQYHEPLSFTMTGISEEASGFSYVFKTKEEVQNGEGGKTDADSLNIGKYYVLYGYYVKDTYHSNTDLINSDAPSNYAYGFSIVPAEIAAAENLRWVGDGMAWDAVTKTSKNGTIEADVISGYTVRVYKNDVLVRTLDINNSTSSSNFGNNISSDTDLKEGKYTFTVQAKINEEYKDRYSSAVTTNPENGPVFSAPKAIINSEGAGILSAQISGGTSSVVLVPGKSGQNERTIEVTVKPGFDFVNEASSWQVSEGVSGITFDTFSTNVVNGVTVYSAQMHIADDYSGPTEITVTPVAKDQTAPSITSYTTGTQGTLSATAQDDGTGIKYYAFSTETDANNVEFKEVDSVKSGEFSVENEAVSKGGKYYFYVKDQDGNVTKTEKTIDVTEVNYHNYYENNSLISDCKEYITNTTEYTLKTSIRAGYAFEGWYSDEALTSKVENITGHNTETGINLYAKWEAESLAGAEVSSYSAVYDGTAHDLTVTLPTGLTGTIQYQWQKKNGEVYENINGANEASISVKDVKDSGDYQVIVSVEQSQVMLTLQSQVTITKATAKVKAKDYTISFLSEAPAYEIEFVEGFGLLESNETEKNQVEQSIKDALSISCSYEKDQPVGDYYIYVKNKNDEAATSMNIDNYTVEILHPNDQTQTGVLKVTTKEDALSAAFHPGEEFDAEHPEFTYALDEQGNAVAFTPAVLVKDGETTLTAGADYTLRYENNDKVGTAKAIVEFKGNYSGSITLEFTIRAATGEVSMEMSKNEWTYGEAAGVPQIVNKENLPTELQNAKVTYYYAKVSAPAETSTEILKDAGEYQVYAVLSEMDNFEDITTEAVNYKVNKRKLTLTAGSLSGDDSCEYDGTVHQNKSYTLEGDFAPGEGFNSVIVALEDKEGAGLKVGAYKNTINYTLSSITKEDNYDIQVVEGEIVITAGVLSYPANAIWSMDNPGTITWVPISKENLEVSYEVTLYAKLGEEETLIKNGESDTFLVEKGELAQTPNKLDLSSIIREYADNAAKDNKAYTFYFTIQTHAKGGANKENYVSGGASDKIGPFCTAVVTVAKDGEGVDKAYFDIEGKEGKPSKILILQGENISAMAVSKNGYIFEAKPWKLEGGNGMLISRQSTEEDQTSSEAKIYTARMTQSTLSAVMSVKAKDQEPEIVSYTGSNSENLSYINLNFELKDSANLKGWMITSTNQPPEVDAAGWENIPEEKQLLYTGSKQISAAGTYYLWVKDAAGNVVGNGHKELVEDEEQMVYLPINVYEIKFNKGESAKDKNGNDISPTGSMPSIYKVENSTIKLPEVQFQMEGFAFQNWHGKTGIYENSGNYGANANDTLVAYWTNHAYDYKVFYHFEGLDGKYPEEVESSNILTFNDLYGTEVSYNNSKIQKKTLGFELDTNPAVYGGEDQMHITITKEDEELHVYYKRLSYNITYQVYLPGVEEPETETVTKKFGEVLSGAWAKPAEDAYAGYHFVGWLFGETESNPTTMPASDITVVGRYEPKEASYHIYKYLQKLDADGKPVSEYDLVSDVKYDNMTGLHGDKINVDASLTGEEEGFTYKGTIVNQMKTPLTSPASDKMKEADVATLVYSEDHSGDICIHMYYTRNSYEVRLKVWQGEIGKTENLKKNYDLGTLYYGATISPDKLAEYNEHEKEDWKTDIPETYSLLEDVFYSTGAAPTVMPAGDLIINRQYVNQLKGKYYVEIWMETDTDHVYTPYLFNYEGTVGDTVTLGSNSQDSTISYNDYENAIPYFKYYEYKKITSLDGVSPESGKTLGGAEVLSGTITATEAGAEPLVLRVFLDRKVITTTITYYYNDGTMAESQEFATVTKKRKWGEDEDSKYYYEPLAYFDTTAGGQFEEYTVSKNVTYSINGTSADQYNFRANGYLVSYTSRYDIKDDDHYKAREFNTEDSGKYPVLDGEKKQDTYPMGYANNRVSVYYTKPEPEKQKVVQVVYKRLEDSVDVPLTYSRENKIYNIYVANEAYFYKDAVFSGGKESEKYPGLKYVKEEGKDARDYTYTKTNEFIKDGFEKIMVDGKEYYIEESANRIYIPDPSNQFYSGHMVYYAYPETEIGFDKVKDYMTQYETAHNPVTIWISNRSIGSRVIIKTNDADTQETLRITFYPRGPIHAHFIINGVDCYEQHEYPYGRELNTATLSCNHAIHTERPGYEIVWYKNLETSEKYTETVKPTGDLYLYGRYEKKTLQHKARAYYQLPYEVELDSNSYRFITEKELDKFEGKYTSSKSDGITTYTYNDETSPNHGQVFMVEKTIPVESFKGVATSATDPNFVKTGFKYDSANADNMLSGYAEADPLNLRVYYVRNKHTVTINSGIPKTNKENIEYLYGQKVVVTAPERGGYSFPGWTVEPTDAVLETQKKESEITFSMPDYDIVFSISQDKWNASAISYEQEIWHYFQNTDLNYNTSLAGELNKATANECTVIYNGNEYSGHYVEDIGAYYTEDKDTYYFTGGVVSTKEEATLYTVTAENLVAIKQVTNPTQNTTVNAGTYAKTEQYYNFSHINYRYDTDVSKLVKSESEWPTFTVNHGMTVEYFYTLQADFNVSLEGKATDGKSVGQLQLLGAKDYFYGEEVHLKASVPAGYTFLGWYRAGDIVTSEDSVSVKENCNSISTEAEYTFICREGGNYVALIEAEQAAGATITPDGINKLTYGYKSSPSNAVTAKISYEVEDHASSRVQSYAWKIYKKNDSGVYEELTNLPAQSGASFLIPMGLDAGEYKLDCEAIIENRYTGRTITTKVEGYELSIEKKTVAVSSSGYEETYDAKAHSIKVVVNKEACENIATEIYYSEIPLDEANYTSGSKDILNYKDVKLDENKEVDAYTIYYYVVPVAGGEGGEKYQNYQGAKGSNTVTIHPKQITLSSGQTHFSKVYDGEEEVEGTLTDVTSDKYKLVHGTENIYEINGLLDADRANAYIIDCKAMFDDRHTTKAKTVTLSEIKLALSNKDSGGETVIYDTNYIFEESYAITLSGYITKKPLEVTWDSQFTSKDGVLEIIYDGTVLCPTAVISTVLPSVDEGKLTLTSAGGQKNCGSYEASLVLSSNSEDTLVSDYVLTTSNVQYKILPRPLVITPVNRTVDYDGSSYTLVEYTLNENGLLEEQGHILSCEGDKSYTSGTHSDIKMTNVSIKDSYGTELKDNYDISCPNGILTITEGGIKVSGIKIKSKIYDGTTSVSADQIDLSELVITGVRTEDIDKVSIDPTKIVVHYDNKNVGEDKKVTLDLSNALVDSTGGYRIVTEGDDASQNEATANITKKTLTLSADNLSIVYGKEQPGFSVSYSGFAEGESKENVSITGEVSYKIASVVSGESSLEQANVYVQKTAVGSYHIYPVIDGLSADNYDFAYAKGTLTVNPRPVQAVKTTKASDNLVTKSYDGKNTANVGDNSIISADYYEFTKVENVTESGLLEGDSINLSYTSAVYNSKDVKDASDVTVTGLGIDNSNYVLREGETKAQYSLSLDGKITAIPLTIKAEEKKVTYGITSNPVYTVTYEGFLEEEKDTHGDLSGTIGYDCNFDCNNPANRNAGTYDITPKGVTSKNYDITFEKNTLTVESATLTVKLVKQGDSNKSTNGWDGSIRVVYGTDQVPTFEPACEGLMYDDHFDLSKTTHEETCVTGTMVAKNEPIETMEITVNDGTTRVVVSQARDYVYNPTQNLTSCGNYKIDYKNTIVTVEKHPLTVTGIQIKDRVYDGTKLLHQTEVDASNANFEGLIQVDIDHCNAKPADKGIVVVGTYYSKDVLYSGDEVAANKVSFSELQLSEYLSTRYVIQNSQSSYDTCKITPRPVTITAKDIEVPYGSAEDVVTSKLDVTYEQATYDGEQIKSKSGFVKISGTDTYETADKNNVTLSFSGYQGAPTYTAVGEYQNAITASNYDDKDTATAKKGNYQVNKYVQGTLKVTQAQLSAPAISWSDADDKVGVITWEEVAGIGDVTVAGYETTLYKDGVEVTVEGSTKTHGSDIREYNYSNLIHAQGAGKYTVKIRTIADITNNTDYANVASSELATSTRELYATKVSFVFASDEKTQNGKGNSITIQNKESYIMIAGEKDIPIQATIKNATGYTIKAVKPSNSVVVVDNDTDTARNENGGNGDTYLSKVSMGKTLNSVDPINVELQLNPRPATVSVSVSAEPSSVEYGYKEETAPKLTATVGVVNDNITTDGYTYTYEWYYIKNNQSMKIGTHSDSASSTDTIAFPTGEKVADYLFACVVTAKRKDNEEITKSVKNIAFNTNNSYVGLVQITRATFTAKVTMDGWTYGESRKQPSVINAVANGEPVTSVQHPGLNNVTYSYIDMATYEADSSAEWSNKIPTNAGTYYVKATIPESDSYKEFTTEKEVFEIKPNKLSSPAPVSINVSDSAAYGHATWTPANPVKENAGVNAASEIGVTYEIDVWKWNEQTHKWEEKDMINDEDQSHHDKDITHDIQEIGEYKVSVTAKSNNEANCANSDTVESAVIKIGATISVKYADENAVLGEDGKYTKEYDGEKVTLTANYNGGEEVVSYNWYKGNTLVQTSDSSNELEIKHVEDSGSYTCAVILKKENEEQEDIHTPYARINITPRPVTLTSDGGEKVYDGQPLLKKEQGNVKDTKTEDASTAGFVTGEGAVYSAFNETQINVGESNNTFTYTLKEGTTASDYTITQSYGAFKITERPIAFEGEKVSKMYTGGKLESEGFGYTQNGLDVGIVNGHVVEVDYKAEGTEVGSYNGTFTSIKIYSDETKAVEVTGNYKITSTVGTLTITQSDADWTISLADSSEYTYDAEEHSTDKTASSQAITGETSFKYSFEENGFEDSSKYVTDLSQLKKTNAGTYPIYVQATNPNYSKAATTNANLVIKKRPVTFTGKSEEKQYTGNEITIHTLEVSGDGLVEGHNHNVVFEAKGTDSNTTEKPNYQGVITEKNAVKIYAGDALTEENDVTDNYDITVVAGTLTIKSLSVFTISMADSSNLTYNKLAQATNQLPDSSDALQKSKITYSYSFTNDSATATTDLSSLTKVDAGTYPIYVWASHPDYSNIATCQANLIINKAPANIAITPVGNKTYGDSAFDLSVIKDTDGNSTFTSNNETVLKVDANGKVSIQNAGTAKLTVTTPETSNYLAGTAEIDITVAKKDATLAISNVTYNKTYGDDDFAIGDLTTEGQSAVTYESSDSTVASVDATGKVTIHKAGTATITLKMAESGNYNAASTTATIIVSPKAITVTADNKEKIYGEDDSVFAYSYTPVGLVGQDTLQVSYEREEGENQGTYLITPVVTPDNNYVIEPIKGTLTIKKKAVTAELSADNKVYDGSNVATVHATIPQNEMVGTDVIVIEGITAEFVDANVGTQKTVTANVNAPQFSGSGYENYDIAIVDSATADITAKQITVTITPNGGVYHGTIVPAEGALNDLVEGENPEITLVYSGTANDGTQLSGTDTIPPTLAGTYMVTASITDTNYELVGTVASDYVVERASANLQFTTGESKIYLDPDFTLEVTKDTDADVEISGGDPAILELMNDHLVVIHDVGKATFTAHSDETANYAEGNTTLTITVGKKDAQLAITEIEYVKTYGDEEFTIGQISFDGESTLIYTSDKEEVVTVDASGKVTVKNAGEAIITVSAAESDHYKDCSLVVKVKVEPKEVVVKAQDSSKVYAGEDPEFTYSTEGLVPGDQLNVSFTRVEGENVGNYDILPVVVEDANYRIICKKGVLTIEPRDISNATVTLGSGLYYNEKEQNQEIQSVILTLEDGRELEVTYEVEDAKATKPGVYTLKVVGKGNFTGTTEKQFTIVQNEEKNDRFEIGEGCILVTLKTEKETEQTSLITHKREIVEYLIETGDIDGEMLAMIADGGTIEIVLHVKDGEQTVSPESKKLISEHIKDYILGQYLDITLSIYVRKNNMIEKEITIKETPDRIYLVLSVSQEMLDDNPNGFSELCVVRNHDGQVEFLDTEYYETTQKMSFGTDRFSDYAVVYKKKVVENTIEEHKSENQNEQNQDMVVEESINDSEVKSPKTGDDTDVLLWYLVFAFCGTVLAGSNVYVKRRKNRKF